MITLLVNEISQALKKDASFQALLDDFRSRRLPVEVEGSQGFFQALLVQALAASSPGPVFVVAPTDAEATAFAHDLESLGLEVDLFPWWGPLLYQGISAPAQVFGQRSRVLSRLVSGQAKIVLVSLRSLLFPVLPKTDFKAELKTWKIGNTLHVAKVADQLTRLGYGRVPRVSVPGEFALRGEVLDLYLQGDDDAVRVVFDFDTIDEIKRFNPLTQASTKALKELTVYPARELILTQEHRTCLEGHLQRLGMDGSESVLESLALTGDLRGVELYYPLAWPAKTGLWDWAEPGVPFLFLDRDHSESLEGTLKKEWAELFKQSQAMGLHLPPPAEVFFSPKDLEVIDARSVWFRSLHDEGTGVKRHKIDSEPPRSFFGNVPFLQEEIGTLLANRYKVFVFAESQSQAQRIEFLLKDHEVTIIPQGISAGFSLPRQKIAAIGENEIFGRRKRAPASLKKTNSEVIESFVDLSPQDYVVHVNYGIGQFQGIERIKAGGNERDYIKV